MRPSSILLKNGFTASANPAGLSPGTRCAAFSTTASSAMRKRRGELRLEEIARLDSEPRMPPAFNGQWGIFPLGSSRTIVASDIVNGLMVMRLDRYRDWDYYEGPMIASTRTTPTPLDYILSRLR